MIYGVLKGRGGNNSLMRVALSVHIFLVEFGAPWLCFGGDPEYFGCPHILVCPVGLRGVGWMNPSSAVEQTPKWFSVFFSPQGQLKTKKKKGEKWRIL